ncbi:caspase-8-like isoform X2 [Synchiropus splendidus]|uniref:caspase-8-like isoform X2 n=1 Tax=Synchiropus splendidus TaxID=270530 RepID=UPI00237DFCEC|nr:caspase-8-like isoform X2 [Synchiropus splendidus]
MSSSSHGRPAMAQAVLLQIDQELESHEVAALCFLCRDVVSRKSLEKVQDAKGLFTELSDRGLLDHSGFLAELLETINRNGLLNDLRTHHGWSYDTDATPILSDYRKMLYNLYDNCSQESIDKMKFLLLERLGKRAIEKCETALDVFAEMERCSLLSNTDLDLLHEVLSHVDRNLATTVRRYKAGNSRTPSTRPQNLAHQSQERVRNTARPMPDQEPVSVDAQPIVSPSLPNDEDDDYYPLNHVPRGPCVIFNNENFTNYLSKRRGTDKDEDTLRQLFSDLGFRVTVYNDLTASRMREVLQELSTQDFSEADALVVLVLSHGENQIVFGSDAGRVTLKELTHPFKSNLVPSLARKPKLFFIQACQGNDFQTGLNLPPTQLMAEAQLASDNLQEDAGPVLGETIPAQADFLLGMATVPEHRSFRRITSGSIYIQELCKQLRISAQSPRDDDILTVLTRVNREISKQDFMQHKQMPEPKYTLTRKLVLKLVQ